MALIDFRKKRNHWWLRSFWDHISHFILGGSAPVLLYCIHRCHFQAKSLWKGRKRPYIFPQILLTTWILLNQPPLPSLVAFTIACLYFVYCLSVVCAYGVLGYKLSVGKGQNLQSILQNTYISVNILAWSKYLLKHALQLSKRHLQNLVAKDWMWLYSSPVQC